MNTTSPQILAREIVEILINDGNLPGEGIPLPALRYQFGFRRPIEDWEAAKQYAIDRGWIKLINSGGFVILEPEGFAAA